MCVIDLDFPEPTSLDPEETNPHCPAPPLEGESPRASDDEISFRHSGWSRLRGRVAAALARVYGDSPRLRRFLSCGSRAWIYRAVENPDLYACRSDTCRDRWCSPCSQFRGRVIAANLSAFCERRSVRFLTLTLRSAAVPLADSIARLYRSFTKLRRSRTWSAHVLGGAAVLEVTFNASTGLWHPHLHCLVEGSFFPHAALRSAWLRASGDSFVCDIRPCPTADNAASYLTKYITKPYAHSWINRPEQLDEALRAFNGLRTCLTFGSWRGLRLTRLATLYTWEPVAALPDVLSRAAQGDPWAAALLNHLKGETKCQSNDLPIRSPPARSPAAS